MAALIQAGVYDDSHEQLCSGTVLGGLNEKIVQKYGAIGLRALFCTKSRTKRRRVRPECDELYERSYKKKARAARVRELYEESYKNTVRSACVRCFIRKIVQIHGTCGQSAMSCTKDRTKIRCDRPACVVLYEKSYKTKARVACMRCFVRNIVQNHGAIGLRALFCTIHRTKIRCVRPECVELYEESYKTGGQFG